VEKKILSAQDILDAQDIVTEVVDVPEWGGSVILRTLTGAEAIQLGKLGETDKEATSAQVLVLCAVDEKGERIFSEGDVELLKKKSMRAMLRVQKAAMEINGLTEEAPKDAKKD
jgi:hypothetical protein